MLDYLMNDDKITKTYKGVTWNGVFDAVSGKILHNGVSYTSLSNFLDQLKVSVNGVNGGRGGNGWDECIVLREQSRYRPNDLPKLR